MFSVHKLIDHIGGERIIPHLHPEDALPPPPDPFPNLAIWRRPAVYGLMLNGHTTHISSSSNPLLAIQTHRLLGLYDFDRVWIIPSHPDRIAADLREARRRHKL